MRLIPLFAIGLSLPSLSAGGERIDLSPLWDAERPLANPDKGWYHHYYDNRITSYLADNDEEITAITGMDHLYLRLAWSYLEPEEGKFAWPVIDKIIDHWAAKGLGIAFRITCKEVGTHPPQQQFATPRWVMEAGAKGGFYSDGKPATEADAAWEPDFGDPIFLEKLDQFLAAFAERYDGKHWLRYIDVGSIGDWGEGPLGRGSHKRVSFETRRAHIDLHLKHFKKTQPAVTDDYVYELRDKGEIDRLHRHIVDKGPPIATTVSSPTR